MFCDGSVDAVYDRLGFAGEIRDAERPLTPFDTGPRNINDITHDFLLPDPRITLFHLYKNQLCWMALGEAPPK
jgi:hypothetical protein